MIHSATASASASNSPRSTSVEFVVIPQDDLYLEGNIKSIFILSKDIYICIYTGEVRKLFRVPKGTPYPCQMQKSQNFGCLFRHYAKHNGLRSVDIPLFDKISFYSVVYYCRKEDLVFYFTDVLSQDQTPESVHLMSQDEIWVSFLLKNEISMSNTPVLIGLSS